MAKRILICDDLASDRLLLRQMLSKLGFEVLEAKSGTEGIVMAKSQKPDAIFMDLVMPDKSGFEATRTITKDPETAHIPVIILSTKDRGPDIMNSKTNGAQGHISKPAKLDNVKENLSKLNLL